MSRTLFAALTLLALSGAPACVVAGSGDGAITCSYYDDFLYYCTDTCTPTWDCESSYAYLSYRDQDRLDVCSDCLVANLDAGICADCSLPSYGVYSCYAFMEQLLGVSCW